LGIDQPNVGDIIMLDPLLAFTIGFAAIVLATWSVWFVYQTVRYCISRATDWAVSVGQCLGFVFGFPAHVLRVMRKRSRRSRHLRSRPTAFSLYRPPSPELCDSTPAWYTDAARAQARTDRDLLILLRQANEERIT
jgi:hypothetical protein